MARPTRGNKPGSYGKIPESMRMYLDMGRITFTLYENIVEESPTPILRLVIRFPGQKKWSSINLTGMTVTELDLVTEIFNKAVTQARPICAELDAMAQKDYEDGTHVHFRTYRPIPTLIEIERRTGEHGPGLPSGPGGVPELDPGHASDADGTASSRARSELRDSEPEGVGTDDNEA